MSAAIEALEALSTEATVEALRTLERSVASVRDLMLATATLARNARNRIQKIADEARAAKAQADLDLAEAEAVAAKLAADLAPAVPTLADDAVKASDAEVTARKEEEALVADELARIDSPAVQQCVECKEYVEQAEPLSGGLGFCDGCYGTAARAAMLKAALLGEEEATVLPVPTANGRKGRRRS